MWQKAAASIGKRSPVPNATTWTREHRPWRLSRRRSACRSASCSRRPDMGGGRDDSSRRAMRLGLASVAARARESSGRVRSSNVMKTSVVSLFKHVVWRGGGWQVATTPSVPSVLATLTPDAIAAVPEQEIPAAIGELERIKLALSARLTAPAPATDNGNGPDWIDAAEVARRLSLPDTYIEELARRGELPSVKLGKYRRYPVAAVR